VAIIIGDVKPPESLVHQNIANADGMKKTLIIPAD
jgi:hypothetical protein